MELFEQFGIDLGYVVIGMAAVIIILFILLLITMIKDANTRKKYRIFMDGENGKNLEKAILDKFAAIDDLSEDTKNIHEQLENIDGRLIKAYQKVGLVKYDAFNEMGGKLSFALAMLDNNNTGWIINAMHSREGCYTYVKEIVKGESYVELAEEEAEALDKAIFEDGYEEEVDKAVASATGSLKSVKSGPAKNGNQKSANARNTKQTSGKANNGKILNARTSNVRPDMARPEKNRK